MGVLEPLLGSMLATYRSHGACWNGFGAVCWQPTGLMGRVGTGLGQYVGNLHVLLVVLEPVWGSMLATYRQLATCMFYGVCWSQLGAVCWQPTGRMGRVGTGLGLYVGNLYTGLMGVLEPVWGSTLATYMSYRAVWGSRLATYRQYVGNLQVLCGVLEWVWGCMLATYRSYGACWNGIGAVCWQPTGRVGRVWAILGEYVGNPQVSIDISTPHHFLYSLIS